MPDLYQPPALAVPETPLFMVAINRTFLKKLNLSDKNNYITKNKIKIHFVTIKLK